MYYLNANNDKEYLGFKHSDSILRINSYDDGYYNIDTDKYKNIIIRDYALINNFLFIENDLIGDSVTSPLLSDLEVMYIGQAFGRNESKKIDYRLANHDKVQKIALDIINSGSNEEVLIIGVKLSTNDLTTIFISDPGNKKTKLFDINDLHKQVSDRVPEGQEITVFEASLIKYFQTDLNIEYKNTFPSPDFKSYEDIYKTSFNYSSFALDTRPLGVRLFSKKIIDRKYIHAQHFPLSSNSDKRNLIDYIIEPD